MKAVPAHIQCGRSNRQIQHKQNSEKRPWRNAQRFLRGNDHQKDMAGESEEDAVFRKRCILTGGLFLQPDIARQHEQCKTRHHDQRRHQDIRQ